MPLYTLLVGLSLLPQGYLLSHFQCEYRTVDETKDAAWSIRMKIYECKKAPVIGLTDTIEVDGGRTKSHEVSVMWKPHDKMVFNELKRRGENDLLVMGCESEKRYFTESGVSLHYNCRGGKKVRVLTSINQKKKINFGNSYSFKLIYP